MDTIRVKLHFFAKARELVGTSNAELDIDKCLQSLQGLQSTLENKFEVLKQLKRCYVIAVNEEYVDESTELNLASGDEIAVIPPLSGG